MLLIAAAFAAEPCPDPLPLGTAEVRICPGRVVIVRGKGIVEVDPAPRGETHVVGLAPGDATLVFADERTVSVHVSPCQDHLRALEARARQASLQGLTFECRGSTVFVRAERRQSPMATGILRSWEDAEDVVFQPAAPPPDLVLRIEAFHLTRERALRWGLDLSNPLALMGRAARSVKEGFEDLDGGLVASVGHSDVASNWYDVREVPLSVGSEVEVWLGEQTRMFSGRGGATQEVRTGLKLKLTDVQVLSAGHSVRGRLEVGYAAPVRSGSSGQVLVDTVRSTDQVSVARLRYQEPTIVATWRPDHPVRANHSLLQAEGLDPLNQLLGSGESIDHQEELQVMVTLLPRPTKAESSTEIRARGQTWMEEVSAGRP